MTGESSMRIDVEVLCDACTAGIVTQTMRLVTDVEGSDTGLYKCPRCGIEVTVRMRITN